MTIDDFLQDHLILIELLPPDTKTLSVQKKINDGGVITEILVDKPLDLVKVVLQNGCYVSCIRWWHRVTLNEGSPIGMGGPRDPRDPNNYFFSEVVHIEKAFEQSATEKDYCDYITEISQMYPIYDLYPGFDIEPNC